MNVDAIVNAANTELMMGSGVCGAIFRAAGIREMQSACQAQAPIKTGTAAITPGFHLPAPYVIHAAGPIYYKEQKEVCKYLLYAAYTSSLQLAHSHRCASIAFPLISSGIYGYPKEEALQVATEAITDFLIRHDMDIYLAIYDKNFFAVNQDLLDDIADYIELCCAPKKFCLRALPDEGICEGVCFDTCQEKELDSALEQMDEPFSHALLKLIDAKGKTDVEVYKKANIDRKLFSKIRTGNGYIPKKPTILALAVALELTLEETDDLLERAGYALSHANKLDIIVEYFIIHGKYNIFDINKVLFHYGQPQLGSHFK